VLWLPFFQYIGGSNDGQDSSATSGKGKGGKGGSPTTGTSNDDASGKGSMRGSKIYMVDGGKGKVKNNVLLESTTSFEYEYEYEFGSPP
jgi:hypothetical protein